MKKEVHLFVTPLVHPEYTAKKVEELCEKLGANFFMEETTTYSFNELPENRASIIFSSLVASLQLSKVISTIDYKNICLSLEEGLKA